MTVVGSEVCVVERLDPADLTEAGRVLAAAYHDDPVHAFLLPDEESRRRVGPAYFRWLLGEHLRRGWAAACARTGDGGDLVGVVAWRPADPSGAAGQARNAGEPGPTGRVASGAGAGRVVPPVLRSTALWSGSAAAFAFTERNRPVEGHQYLELIGVLPPFRSRSIGSRLLSPVTDSARIAGVGVWTWSSNPRNLTFYRRAGFTPGAKRVLPGGGPVVTDLWHDVIRPSGPAAQPHGTEEPGPSGPAAQPHGAEEPAP